MKRTVIVMVTNNNGNNEERKGKNNMKDNKQIQTPLIIQAI